MGSHRDAVESAVARSVAVYPTGRTILGRASRARPRIDAVLVRLWSAAAPSTRPAAHRRRARVPSRRRSPWRRVLRCGLRGDAPPQASAGPRVSPTSPTAPPHATNFAGFRRYMDQAHRRTTRTRMRGQCWPIVAKVAVDILNLLDLQGDGRCRDEEVSSRSRRLHPSEHGVRQNKARWCRGHRSSDEVGGDQQRLSG